jgi:conjugal transfer pilus assembly protein TraV
MPHSALSRTPRLLPAALALAMGGCAPLGALMSPYSETFSCKNDDHGQCVHPERAHADAVAGVASRSDPTATTDPRQRERARTKRQGAAGAPFGAYRDSVYRELKGLIEAPVTPMLRPARTVRTLILPYADRQRPDRLYMPRYIYSILDRPEWVVGSTLTGNSADGIHVPILSQIRGTAPEGAQAPILPVPDTRP